VTTAYNALPDPLPVSLPAQNFEAAFAAEFGNQVELTGTDRILVSVTVGMVTWAYWSKYNATGTPTPSWSHPITLNVYAANADDSPGSLLGSVTQTFDIPWRAEPDAVNCPGGTRWYSTADTLCHNGVAFSASFDFSAQGLTLPDRVVFGVAFNTQSAGLNPLGAVGPYNDLAVGVATTTVGVNPVAPQSYLNSSAGSAYADGGAGGTGTFRLDAGSDNPNIAIEFNTEATMTPPGNGAVPPIDPQIQAIFDAMTVYMQTNKIPSMNTQSTLTGNAVSQTVNCTKLNGDSYTYSYFTKGTSVIVSPASTSLGPNQTQQFTAIVYNPDGSIALGPVSWSMVNGPGSIDQTTGLYTAPGNITSPVNANVRAMYFPPPAKAPGPAPAAGWSTAAIEVHP
jgi:hypothetical protein